MHMLELKLSPLANNKRQCSFGGLGIVRGLLAFLSSLNALNIGSAVHR